VGAPSANLTAHTAGIAPKVVQFTASDPDNLDSVYSNGDTLTIGFDIPTNMAGATGTLTKQDVDALLQFSVSLGSDYTGSWSTNQVVVITIVDSTGNGAPQPGSLSGVVQASSGLRNLAGDSLPTNMTVGTLAGNWGLPGKGAGFVNPQVAGIPSEGALADLSQSTVTAPGPATVFTLTITPSTPTNSMLILNNSTFSNLVLSGNASALTAQLATLHFSSPSSYFGPAAVAFVLTTTDIVDSQVLTFVIAHVNHPPVITLVSPVVLSFNTWQSGVSLMLTDPDSTNFPDTTMTFTLVGSTGVQLRLLTLPPGVTVSAAALTPTSALTIAGTLTNVQAALASLQMNFVLTSLASIASVVPITASLMDESATSTLVVSGTTSCVGSDPAVVASAMFQGWTTIAITLDRVVQYAAKDFNCSQLLVDTSTLGSNPTCRFSTQGNTVKIFLGPGATILPANNLATVANTVLLKACPAATSTPGSVLITVGAPPSLGSPVATISGQPTYSACPGQVVSLVGSATNLGFRDGVYMWTPPADFTGQISFTTPTLAFPIELLPLGSSAVFTLVVTNFLGSSSSAVSFTVSRSALAVPSLSLVGQASFPVDSGSSFTLKVQSTVAACLTGTARLLSFQWSVIPSAPGLNLSVGSSALTVPANTLLPGTTYQFQLVGAMVVDSTLSSSVIATVSVNQIPVAARIAGGNAQIPFAQDSFFSSASTFNALLSATYTWRCTTLAGDPCVDQNTLSVISFPSNSTIKISAQELDVGTYTFGLTVLVGGVTDTTSISVVVLPGSPPRAGITADTVVSNSSAIHLQAIQDPNDPAFTPPGAILSYHWELLTAGYNLSDLSLGQDDVQLTVNSLLLPVFVSGDILTFQLTVTDSNGMSSSTATVDVRIARSPYGGVLEVSPLSGTAFNTTVIVSTNGWIDPDFDISATPLLYEYFYIIGGQSKTLSFLSTSTSISSSQLPSGTYPIGVRVVGAGHGFEVSTVNITLDSAFQSSSDIASFFTNTGGALGDPSDQADLACSLISEVNTQSDADLDPQQQADAIFARETLVSAIATQAGDLPLSSVLTAFQSASSVPSQLSVSLLTTMLSTLDQVSASVAESNDLDQFKTALATMLAAAQAPQSSRRAGGAPGDALGSMLSFASQISIHALVNPGENVVVTGPSGPSGRLEVRRVKVRDQSTDMDLTFNGVSAVLHVDQSRLDPVAGVARDIQVVNLVPCPFSNDVSSCVAFLAALPTGEENQGFIPGGVQVTLPAPCPPGNQCTANCSQMKTTGGVWQSFPPTSVDPQGAVATCTLNSGTVTILTTTVLTNSPTANPTARPTANPTANPTSGTSSPTSGTSSPTSGTSSPTSGTSSPTSGTPSPTPSNQPPKTPSPTPSNQPPKSPAPTPAPTPGDHGKTAKGKVPPPNNPTPPPKTAPQPKAKSPKANDGATCVPPLPAPGYVVPNLNCSGLTAPNFVCDATCAVGYFGTVAYSCPTQGTDLKLAGCSPCAPACASCWGPNVGQCSSCVSGFGDSNGADGGGSCARSCDIGYFDADSSADGVQCMASTGSMTARYMITGQQAGCDVTVTGPLAAAAVCGAITTITHLSTCQSQSVSLTCQGNTQTVDISVTFDVEPSNVASLTTALMITSGMFATQTVDAVSSSVSYPLTCSSTSVSCGAGHAQIQESRLCQGNCVASCCGALGEGCSMLSADGLCASCSSPNASPSGGADCACNVGFYDAQPGNQWDQLSCMALGEGCAHGNASSCWECLDPNSAVAGPRCRCNSGFQDSDPNALRLSCVPVMDKGKKVPAGAIGAGVLVGVLMGVVLPGFFVYRRIKQRRARQTPVPPIPVGPGVATVHATPSQVGGQEPKAEEANIQIHRYDWSDGN
jgi:hypothetical protein